LRLPIACILCQDKVGISRRGPPEARPSIAVNGLMQHKDYSAALNLTVDDLADPGHEGQEANERMGLEEARREPARRRGPRFQGNLA
jgi:hypothetical protein